ncbi:hypothetical protein JNL27_12420 [bacterium]|nr:hypothetical protein [bacterium]
MKKLAKLLCVGAILCYFAQTNAYAQKPSWVDNPGIYSSENFVGVGVAKDSKADKARAKAEKKAIAGIEKILKNKYPKKEIKSSMSSIRIESYWQDPMTKYYYVLALLPMEAIDKNYAAQKKADKARSSAMSALKMLNAQTADPDVAVIKVDDDVTESESGAGEMEVEGADVEQPVETKAEIKKETTTVSSVASVATSNSAATGNTDFANKSFGSFKWSDQDQNSKYSLLGDGYLTVNVVSDETWDPKEGNKRAPRVETADVKGSFTAIAKVKADWSKYRVGFGICAHSGKQNVISKVFYSGSYVYLEGYANDIDLPRTEKHVEPVKGFVYMKLVRSAYSWTAYYSSIEDDWVEIANFETEFPETCNVGVVFLNDEGTTSAMKLEFLKVTQ